MADYWKSQPKKFCQYCKCWIADNKPSVEFHERGKNHKENVAAKIAEIKQKSLDTAKQEARMSKDFATMEAAALKAYEQDIKRIEAESGSQAQTTAATTTKKTAAATTTKKTAAATTKKTASTRTTTTQAQPPPRKQEKSKKGAKGKKPREHKQSEVWVEGKTEDGHTYYYNTITGESQWDRPEGFQGNPSNTAWLGQSESASVRAWMEATSPEGCTYYYNKETGESSWERPAGLPPKEMESQPEPPGTQPVTLSGRKESFSADQASKESESNGQTSQQPKVSNIDIRKRKAETEPSEKEVVKEAVSDDQKKHGGEERVEEKVQTATPVPEQEKKPKIVIQVRKPRKSTPYGAWEKIKQEVDPYVNVDLQLPQVEYNTASVPEELPPEPKPKFKERTITSLGEEGGPASFKRSKAQNVKSRNLRQRGKDD